MSQDPFEPLPTLRQESLMIESPPNSASRSAFASVTSLFFMWGFITCMNDLLIPEVEADEPAPGAPAGH